MTETEKTQIKTSPIDSLLTSLRGLREDSLKTATPKLYDKIDYIEKIIQKKLRAWVNANKDEDGLYEIHKND